MERKFHAICSFLLVLPVLFFMAEDSLGQIPSIKLKQGKGKPLPFEYRLNQPPPSIIGGTPPSGPVHCCAEWEESEGILALWWNYDLMDKLQANIKVYIPVDNQAEETSWITYLTNNNVPLNNIEFLYIKTDSIYTRDYGPWFIWDANNELGIVNYTCHYGYWDDLFPIHFASMFRINYYESGLNHVGGNYLPNGYGNAFSSTLVYTDNHPLTMEGTHAAMYDYYGIERYNTCVVAPWTIEHHDCWGKPANPETIIFDQFPKGSDEYRYGEDPAAWYETLESPWGRPYKILRLPMFPMQSNPWYKYKPYMNTLVSNKHVYVAICNHPDDQVALDVFQEAFPGYEIVGVDHMGCGWTDALHCRTRNFVKRDAIRMYPYPPGDTEDIASGYTVMAEVIPPKGSSLISGYPVIHWTDTGGLPFNDVVMTSTGQPDEYTGDIPPQSLGTTVSFYIEAQDNNGHSAIYPLVAPAGMMHFEIRQDKEAPVLSRFVPARSASASQWPPLIRTLSKDDMATPEVKVEYTINGVPQPDVALNREEKCYWYSGVLGGSAAPGDLVTYRLVATDHASTPNLDTLPKIGQVYCPVEGPGGIAIVDLSRRPYTAPFIAESLGNLGIPFTYYNTWPTDWNTHHIWFFCLGVFADNHVLSPSQSDDIVNALQAGDFIYMETGDGWCKDISKDTLNRFFGVKMVSDGGDLKYDGVMGEPGSIVDGLSLTYVGVTAFVDQINPVPAAKMLFRAASNSKGHTVLYEEGSYRTIASSFLLGGLEDRDWPDTRKEILLRYLDFFGIDGIDIAATAKAAQGSIVPVRLEADPGDEYLLLGSLAENYVSAGGFGTLRLDLNHLFVLGHGLVKPSGIVEVFLPIPREGYLGLEIHLQAVTGDQLVPGKSKLTNRDILTIVE